MANRRQRMHMLMPGVSMDSSARLRDSGVHAIRYADLGYQLCSDGCLISDSLVVPPYKNQAVNLTGRDKLRGYALKRTTRDQPTARLISTRSGGSGDEVGTQSGAHHPPD